MKTQAPVVLENHDPGDEHVDVRGLDLLVRLAQHDRFHPPDEHKIEKLHTDPGWLPLLL